VPLVEQELLTLPKHLSSPPVFSDVCVTRSLVLYVYLVDRFLYFCFGHCVVCSSSIYGLWLPLWYLQTLLLTGNIWLWCNIYSRKTAARLDSYDPFCQVTPTYRQVLPLKIMSGFIPSLVFQYHYLTKAWCN
jgi:hypothetical protein